MATEAKLEFIGAHGETDLAASSVGILYVRVT